MAKEKDPLLRVGDWSSSDFVEPGRTAMPAGGVGSDVPSNAPAVASPAIPVSVGPAPSGYRGVPEAKMVEDALARKAARSAAPAAGTPALPQLGPPQPQSDIPFSADKPLLTNVGRTPTIMGGENWTSPAPGVPKGFASQADYDAYNAKNPVGGAALDLRPGTRGYMGATGLRPSMGGQAPGAAGPAFMANANGSMVTDYPESVRAALPLGGGVPSIGDQTRAILSDKGPADASRVQQILQGFRGSVRDLGGPREVMSYDPERNARLDRIGIGTGVDQGLLGPNGRISRSRARLREQEMQDRGAASRQQSGQEASLHQALAVKALELESQGRTEDANLMRSLAVEQFRQGGESSRQEKDIASREKVAGMGVSQREADSERRATTAEAINKERIGAGQYDRSKAFDSVNAAKAISEDYMNQIPGGTPEGKMEYLRSISGGAPAAGRGAASPGTRQQKTLPSGEKVMVEKVGAKEWVEVQ